MNIFLKVLSCFITFWGRRRLIVLTYHRILAAPDIMRPSEVDAAKLSWQLEILHRYFNVLSLADALEHIKNGTLPSRAVCLTFDDGYESCYTYALPILKQFNLTATFFIVSSEVNPHCLWNDLIVEGLRIYSHNELDLRCFGLGVYSLEDKAAVAEEITQTVKYFRFSKRTELCYKINQLCGSNNPSLMLTANQILALHQQGMEIGGHTVNHPILSTLTYSDVEHEVEQNKKDLENIINAPLRFFAYPNGKLTVDYLPEHAEIIKKCGYEAALTTNRGGIDSKADLYQLPRFTPWDNTPFKFFLRMFSSYFYDYSD